MLRRLLTGLTLAAALPLLQCSDNPTQPDQVKLGEPFVLEVGQSVDVQNEDLSITFREVLDDSRCPTGALCFWSGIAETRVKLARRSGDTAQVTVAIIGDSESAPDEQYAVDTLGYHVVLRRLDPYPDLSLSAHNFRGPESYQATLKITRSIAALAPVPPVIITNLPPDSIQIDHFAIDSISIQGDTLNLAVNYGGGCKNHYFFLYMSPATFMESTPVQANLWLRHFGNSDSCKCDGGKCYNHRKLRFDLKPIAELYSQTYNRIDPIVLNISEYTGNEPEERFQNHYYPQGANQHGLVPGNVGTYWTYRYRKAVSRTVRDSVGHPYVRTRDTTYVDSIAVNGWLVDGGAVWWVLSKDLWPLSDTFRTAPDSVHSRDGLEFVRTQTISSYQTHLEWWGWRTRQVKPLREPYTVDAGVFDGCLEYQDYVSVSHTGYGCHSNIVVAPGVGILFVRRYDYCSPMSFDDGLCGYMEQTWTLQRYKLAEQ